MYINRMFNNKLNHFELFNMIKGLYLYFVDKMFILS